MGLHNGYIVVTASQDDLLAALSLHTGAFAVDAVVEHPDEVELDGGAFDLLLGERDGKAFLIDSSMAQADVMTRRLVSLILAVLLPAGVAAS
jgi:hypothetical protein